LATTQAGKIALVTGGNRGIGYAICGQLADAGMHVILTSRDAAKGAAAADKLRAGKPTLSISSYALDVSDPASVDQVRGYVQKEYGRLDVLVNNAALYLDENVSIFDVDIDIVRQTMETNFYGPLYMCRAFVPDMRKRGYGRVVNVSSESGQLATMGSYTAAYAMSKTALNAMTKIMAAEVGRVDVKVNTMCPGWVRTDMGGPNASLTPDQGADTALWLATLPSDGPSGGFFQNRKPIPW
jgi:NAD(P)-dependent dehydrogenase (short-subunit alcohol dehydrogenase family)